MIMGEDSPGQAGVSVAWLGQAPEQGDASLERAAVYASVLARTLAAVGYQARRLSVGVGREATGVLHLIVQGDVPGISETDFEALTRATLNGVSGRLGFALEPELVVEARLETLGRPLTVRALAAARPTSTPRNWTLVSRLALPLLLGLLLGVVGLPRLELPLPSLPFAARANPTPVVPAQTALTLAQQARPTEVPPTLPPTLVPTPVPPKPSVLLAERFATPVARWPNDPRGTAWFGTGEYRLFARDPGRFVAVGVPLPQPERELKLSAQFHKTGGPAGGGYGFILRDQGSANDRDGHNQSGQYLVVEVGDRGDIGVWQRDQTRWVDVVPWTYSDAVHTDREANVLTATASGPHLQFEVNGTIVADLTYDRLPPIGGVGIFVGGDLNEVALEWLRIETP